jgi:hypothetical protein
VYSLELSALERCIRFAALAVATATWDDVDERSAGAVVLLPLTGLEMHVQRYIVGTDPPVCRSCIGAPQAKQIIRDNTSQQSKESGMQYSVSLWARFF